METVDPGAASGKGKEIAVDSSELDGERSSDSESGDGDSFTNDTEVR
jgi:hypothetical protein